MDDLTKFGEAMEAAESIPDLEQQIAAMAKAVSEFLEPKRDYYRLEMARKVERARAA